MTSTISKTMKMIPFVTGFVRITRVTLAALVLVSAALGFAQPSIAGQQKLGDPWVSVDLQGWRVLPPSSIDPFQPPQALPYADFCARVLIAEGYTCDLKTGAIKPISFPQIFGVPVGQAKPPTPCDLFQRFGGTGCRWESMATTDPAWGSLSTLEKPTDSLAGLFPDSPLHGDLQVLPRRIEDVLAAIKHRPPVACPEYFDPVWALKGGEKRQYSNQCFAEADGAIVIGSAKNLQQ